MKYMLVFYYQNSRQNHNIKTANKYADSMEKYFKYLVITKLKKLRALSLRAN
jgi:hypothetical protein